MPNKQELDNMLEELNVYNTKHGTSDYPLSVYVNTRECYSNKIVLDVHWHKECELMIVTVGTIIVSINNEHYTLTTGQSLFIDSYQLHSSHATYEGFCSFTSIVFNPSMIVGANFDFCHNTFLAPYLSGDLILPTYLDVTNDPNKLIWNYIYCISDIYHDRPSTWSLQIKGYLYLIFGILFQYASASSLATRKQQKNIEQIRYVLDYIDKHLNEPLTTDTLCGIACLNKEYFCRLFKKSTGRTPMDYINNLKMKTAAELLQQSDKKVTEIAFELGYNNLSHFTRLFKRYINQCPKDLRNK